MQVDIIIVELTSLPAGCLWLIKRHLYRTQVDVDYGGYGNGVLNMKNYFAPVSNVFIAFFLSKVLDNWHFLIH